MSASELMMYVASISEGSLVDGPGVRTVLHTQGCSLHCPGCFNPHTWDPNVGGTMRHVEDLAEDLLASNPDGVSISGGEPFEQPALAALLRILRARDTSILIYSGFTYWALLAEFPEIVDGQHPLVDVLVSGPFRKRLTRPTPDMRRITSSANQLVTLLTDRHRHKDFPFRAPGECGQVQVSITPHGDVSMHGTPTTDIVEEVRKAVTK